jgi:glycosyltransferase involved in cell wall biosynthesis
LRPLALALGYRLLRAFHRPARAVLVATARLKAELEARGFRHLGLWSLGVDLTRFCPGEKNFAPYAGLSRPLLLYVGRVAVEKNVEAFLAADLPGSKIVVGDGPDLARLKAAWPAARFMGNLPNEALPAYYAAADLFVFPSKTDSFGLVLLEAAASGLRIACYPAPGPVDLFASAEARAFVAMDEDLAQAARRALHFPDDAARPAAFAARFSWDATARSFLSFLTL